MKDKKFDEEEMCTGPVYLFLLLEIKTEFKKNIQYT